MIAFLARRLAAALLVLLFVSSACFALLEALPGGPGAIVEDPRVPVAQRERLRTVLGLDRPVLERYVGFLAAAARGEWGVSFALQRPVSRVLAEALPHTIALASAALTIELLLGLPLGAAAAKRAEGTFDRALRGFSLVLWSVPSFWLGLALLLALAVELPLLPPGGATSPGATSWPLPQRLLDLAWHLTLPALALGLPAAAGTARFARAALLEVGSEPFLAAARGRGLPPRTLFFRHELRAASASLVQLAGLSASSLLSGALAVEVVFSRPGLGRTTFDALLARDYPVLLGATALAAGAIVLVHLVTEIVQAALDPRIRSRVEPG